MQIAPSSLDRQMQLMNGYHAEQSKANQLLAILCFDGLESKSRLVAVFELYVSFLIWNDHLMLQVPSGASTELCDHNVAVTEEVNVEVGVGTGL